MDEAASIILKLIDEKGIINVGGEPMSPYEFIRKTNPNIGKISFEEVKDVNMGKDSSMNIDKLKTIIND